MYAYGWMCAQDDQLCHNLLTQVSVSDNTANYFLGNTLTEWDLAV